MSPSTVSTSAESCHGDGRMSRMRGSVARRDQLVDDVRADEARAAGDEARCSCGSTSGPVVERDAPVVLGHPVGVRQIVAGAHEAVARLGRRPCRSSARSGRRRCTCRGRRSSRRAAASRSGCSGSSCSRATAFFQATISSRRSVWTSADRGGELAHPEVQAGDGVVGLAVVAERARVREQVRVGARRACRPRRSRPSSSRRTSRRPRRRTCRAGGRSSSRRARARSPRAGRSRASRH